MCIRDSGQTALDIVADNKPDLILLDLMMPGMNGYDVIKQLRAKEETQQLPIIVISALNSNEDVVKGYDLGANDFLTKPIIMNRLHTSVITQLNKAMEAKGMA